MSRPEPQRPHHGDPRPHHEAGHLPSRPTPCGHPDTDSSKGLASLFVPGLVVLGGDVAQAGGPKLAELVQEATARIAPNATEVGLGKIEGSPVVRGALLQALEHARDDVFSSTV